MTLEQTGQRAETLEARGIDPWGTDDTVFGVDFVYCHSHCRAHETGWCTVANANKTPLQARIDGGNPEFYQEATDEARALGFWIYGDARPCVHCDAMVKDSGHAYADDSGSPRCFPDKKRSPFHTPHARP